MIPVNRDAIPEAWMWARDHLLRAIEKSGRWTEADVLAGLLMDQSWRLWVHPKAAVVTRIVQHPQVRVCEIFLLGGSDIEALKTAEPVLTAYAIDKGCHKLEETGRMGWERVASDGWRKTAVRMTKEL